MFTSYLASLNIIIFMQYRYRNQYKKILNAMLLLLKCCDRKYWNVSTNEIAYALLDINQAMKFLSIFFISSSSCLCVIQWYLDMNHVRKL